MPCDKFSHEWSLVDLQVHTDCQKQNQRLLNFDGAGGGAIAVVTIADTVAITVVNLYLFTNSVMQYGLPKVTTR